MWRSFHKNLHGSGRRFENDLGQGGNRDIFERKSKVLDAAVIIVAVSEESLGLWSGRLGTARGGTSRHRLLGLLGRGGHDTSNDIVLALAVKLTVVGHDVLFALTMELLVLQSSSSNLSQQLFKGLIDVVGLVLHSFLVSSKPALALVDMFVVPPMLTVAPAREAVLLIVTADYPAPLTGAAVGTTGAVGVGFCLVCLERRTYSRRETLNTPFFCVAACKSLRDMLSVGCSSRIWSLIPQYSSARMMGLMCF